MKKTWLLAAIVATFGTGLANAANPNLIVNGSFEAQSIPQGDAYQFVNSLDGWNGTSNWRGFILFNSSYQPVSDGVNAVQLEAFGDRLSQTFSTVIGQQYDLSYALSAYYDPSFAKGALLSVSVAGQTWMEQVTVPETTAIRNVTYSFTASATSTTLAFQGMGPTFNSYPQLDNISVTAAVPEPESYAMLLAGLGVVGTVSRRRRTV